jgi:hypothetical protein
MRPAAGGARHQDTIGPQLENRKRSWRCFPARPTWVRNVKGGDLVEVYNDNGSTQAVVYPTPTAKRGLAAVKPVARLFSQARPTGKRENP